MRTNTIDRARVREMLETGLAQKETARRLGCSERQVRRILSDCRLTIDDCRLQKRAVRGDEHLCWRLAFAIEGSYSAVARRFGVTRQAIQQVITQEA